MYNSVTRLPITSVFRNCSFSSVSRRNITSFSTLFFTHDRINSFFNSKSHSSTTSLQSSHSSLRTPFSTSTQTPSTASSEIQLELVPGNDGMLYYRTI